MQWVQSICKNVPIAFELIGLPMLLCRCVTGSSLDALMPELPEVETTLRGLSPHLVAQRIHGVILRRPDLRWPIPEQIERLLPGAIIQ